MYIKTVRRRYYNKTLGEWVQKEYRYETVKKEGKTTTVSRQKRSKLIVGKRGIYEDRLNALLETTNDPAVKADIKAKAKEAQRKGQTLSTRTLISKVASSRIEKMFINAGYAEDQVLDELGITREDLYNEENWSTGGIFTFGGKKYKYHHGYSGSVMRRYYDD